MSRRLLIAGFAAFCLGGGLYPGAIVAQPAPDDGLKAGRELVLAMRATDRDPWWRKALAIPLEYVKLLRADFFEKGC